MQRKTFDFLGGWPEDYFMYCEDLDLCYIAWNKGLNVIQLLADIEHIGGGATSKKWGNFERDVRKEIAGIRFYLKYKFIYNYILCKIVSVGKSLFNLDDMFYKILVIKKAISIIIRDRVRNK